jgi:hypothetical protein
MTPIGFSRHAAIRGQQRGIRPAVVDFVLQHFDVDLEAGDGCRSYRISHRSVAELLRDGVPVNEVDRAKSVVVIVHVDSGEIVTVMHDCSQDGRRFRRQWPTRKRSLKRHSLAA